MATDLTLGCLFISLTPERTLFSFFFRITHHFCNRHNEYMFWFFLWSCRGEICTATHLLKNLLAISSPLHFHLFRRKIKNNTVHAVKQSFLTNNVKHIFEPRQLQSSSRKINNFNYAQAVQVSLFDYMESIYSIFLICFNDSAGVQNLTLANITPAMSPAQ